MRRECIYLIKQQLVPGGYTNLVPDIPEERRRWEAEIRDYISPSYASHVDHLITH